MTILEAVDHDIDDDLPLIAGRNTLHVTDPHGWLVNREREVSASRGRLTVELHGRGYIYDSEDYSEDECQYGVPSSYAEALALADLYREAEEILGAYRSGAYVPPHPLAAYIDRKPRSERGMFGLLMAGAVESMKRQLNSPLFMSFDPLEPYTRQERFGNVWRRMRGEDPIPRREKPKRTGYVKIRLGDGLG